MTDKLYSAAQLDFLIKLQRLLEEGHFVATYKFALLTAIADLCVQSVEAKNDPVNIHLDDVAAKFVELYWRQVTPFGFEVRDSDASELRQNTGRQAKILNLVKRAHDQAHGSLAQARRNLRGWRSLLHKVRRVVEEQPLWKLQTIGNETVEFIFCQNRIEADRIVLMPGVAACIRRFHPLILSLVQAAWMRQIRLIPANRPFLGPGADLAEFLFGSERSSLTAYKPILISLQGGNCFYCERRLRETSADVDHFVPWSRYPIDLGHNFVLAHHTCNGKKRDFLSGIAHLTKWITRNDEFGEELSHSYERFNLFHDVRASTRIAYWAYEQAEAASAKVWVSDDSLVPLDRDWRQCFAHRVGTC